jgi:hypothetical protein
MKSIKQQYIDLQEGNMSQANFMRNLRMTLPQYVTNVTSFKDSVRILKNKGILSEADAKSKDLYADVVNAISKKYGYRVYHDEIEEFMKDKASLEAIMAGEDPIAVYEKFYNIQRESINEAKENSSEGKWKTVTGKDLYAQFKEIDNLNGQEVLIGIDYEMQCNHDLTKVEAAKIVVKNLKKNPIYYTASLMAGKEGFEPGYIGGKSANAEARQMQPLEKNLGNIVDKKMGMQPVKGIEKPKKDADAKKETNKMEKGVSLMSLVAKTVRGVKKMDATGEKMKKITMKEAKLNDFPNETPGKIATQIKDYIDGPNANPTLKKYSDEITLQSNPDGFLRFGYWERLPEDAFSALELQYDIEMDSDEDDDTGTLYFYKLTPKYNRPTQSGVARFLTKDDLMEMIREELGEALGIGGTDSVNFQQDDTAN